MKTIWYSDPDNDPELVRSAIIIASATGSIGATETRKTLDASFNVISKKSATVYREGYQKKDSVRVD